MKRIILDFFGEETSIPISKNLQSIRNEISDKFYFTNSDAQELILYYKKKNENIYINNEKDYKQFLEQKNLTIFLDISQNSQLYQKNVEELKNKEIEEQINELKKKNNELNNLLNTKFENELNEIKKMKKEIKKLKLKMKKLRGYINIESRRIVEIKKENDKKIIELEKKLGQNINYNLNNINNVIFHNRKKYGKNKNKQKISFMKDINLIMKEKKSELDAYANNIKEKLSKSFIINNNNIINNNIIVNNEKLKSIEPKLESLTSLGINNTLGYKCYVNREISSINFNIRILNEAKNPDVPILERIKFCAKTSSNLDEFFMVRVANLQNAVSINKISKDIAGLSFMEQLKIIKSSVKDIITMQYATYNRSLHFELSKIGIELIDKYENLNENQKIFVDNYFDKNIEPFIYHIALDMSSPFPLIPNKNLNISLLLKRKKSTMNQKYNYGRFFFGNVGVPSGLKRLVQIPNSSESKLSFILLENIIQNNLKKLFTNYEIISAHTIRVMRNAFISVDERDMDTTLLDQIEKGLEERQYGNVLRLEVDDEIDNRLLKILKNNLEVKDEDVFRMQGPLDMTFLEKLYDLVPEEFNIYKYPPFSPQIHPRIIPNRDIFAEIRKKDVFLFHPYESFDPVVYFIKQGSEDPNVLAIKITLYKVNSKSPIVEALIKAAENGKQVTILLELKARFDEKNSIKWAKEFEKVGCHVIYGLKQLKTHCKLTLIVRKEDDKIKRYVHMSTGNYNDKSAKTRTDCGILTCRDDYGEDAANLFDMISGQSDPNNWNKLILSPFWMKVKFMTLIDREKENARKGKKALIIAKMNSLMDKMIIDKLLIASKEGVKIHLIVRGLCGLQTGIPGISDNIKVESIIGQLLEHNRIFYFYNDGNEEYYIGSADWMPRNLEKRVELTTPIEDEDIKKKLKHILEIYMADNKNAYYMQPNGSYKKLNTSGKEIISSHCLFYQEAIEASNYILNKKY